jgi:hypothetical protein
MKSHKYHSFKLWTREKSAPKDHFLLAVVPFFLFVDTNTVHLEGILKVTQLFTFVPLKTGKCHLLPERMDLIWNVSA